MKIAQLSGGLATAFVLMAAMSGSGLCQTAASSSQGNTEQAVSQSAASSGSSSAADSSSPSATASGGAVDSSQSSKDAQPEATSGQVLYTVRSEAPVLVDSRVSSVGFGMLSGPLVLEGGKTLVEADNIANPGNDLARKFATYFAAQNGLSADATAIPVAPGKIKDIKVLIGGQHGDARYLVDAEVAGLNLIYFSFDWGHDDLMFMDGIRVFDTQTGKVVLWARCFIPTKKDPDNLKTRNELLANGGQELKVLIAKKTDMCLTMMMDKTKDTIKLSSAPG